MFIPIYIVWADPNAHYYFFLHFYKVLGIFIKKKNLSQFYKMNMCIHVLNLLKLLTFDYKWNTFFSYIYQPFLSLFQWVYIFCQIFYSSIDVFIFLLFIYKLSLYRKDISLLSTMCFVGCVCVFWNLIFDVSKNSIHLLGGISVCYSAYIPFVILKSSIPLTPWFFF